MTVEEILNMIEEGRLAGEISDDQARTASVALQLEGNDAMLACRLIAQGADPASLDYLDTGEVDPKIMEAHRNGPGAYELGDPRLVDYMTLCALSEDESQQYQSSVRGRFFRFFYALQRLNHPDEEFRQAALTKLGEDERDRILALPYSVTKVGGLSMRVYRSDRGFVAATWEGEPCAAVLGSYNGEPYIAIGAPPSAPTLEEQGVKIKRKEKSSRFWIVEDGREVDRVAQALTQTS